MADMKRKMLVLAMMFAAGTFVSGCGTRDYQRFYSDADLQREQHVESCVKSGILSANGELSPSQRGELSQEASQCVGDGYQVKEAQSNASMMDIGDKFKRIVVGV